MSRRRNVVAAATTSTPAMEMEAIAGRWQEHRGTLIS